LTLILVFFVTYIFAYLDEEPRSEQRQTAVLPVEAVVVGVEGEVVQIEEPAIGKKR
jgi:hypothetical protein